MCHFSPFKLISILYTVYCVNPPPQTDEPTTEALNEFRRDVAGSKDDIRVQNKSLLKDGMQIKMRTIIALY